MAVSSTLAELGRRLEARAVEYERRAGEAVRLAAFAGTEVAVRLNPFLTGRSKSNWVVSIGSESRAMPSGPEADFGSPEAAAAQSLTQAAAALRGYRIGGGPIYANNNTPYIVQLDEGSSMQAPRGMSVAALQAAVAVLRQHKILR